MAGKRDHLVPQPIIDKNGRATTVLVNPAQAAALAPEHGPFTTAPVSAVSAGAEAGPDANGVDLADHPDIVGYTITADGLDVTLERGVLHLGHPDWDDEGTFGIGGRGFTGTDGSNWGDRDIEHYTEYHEGEVDDLILALGPAAFERARGEVDEKAERTPDPAPPLSYEGDLEPLLSSAPGTEMSRLISTTHVATIRADGGDRFSWRVETLSGEDVTRDPAAARASGREELAAALRQLAVSPRTAVTDAGWLRR